MTEECRGAWSRRVLRGSEDRVSEEQKKANVEKHSWRECVSMKDIMRKQQQLHKCREVY